MLAAGYWGDEPELGVWLYDTATGEYLKNLKGDFGEGVHSGVAWGSALFISTDNDDVQMWDPATGEYLKTIADDWTFAISLDSRILAAGTGKRIRLIDIGTGQVLRTIEEEVIKDGRRYQWTYDTYAFSPDGSTIAAGARPRVLDLGFENVFAHEIHLYDVATGRKKLASPDLGVQVKQVAWNSDGSRIAIRGSGFGTLMDAATGQPIVPPDDRAVGAIEWPQSIAWSPTAPNILAIGGSRGTIELQDIATWQIPKTLTHGGDVGHLAFSPDGKTLASGSDNDSNILIRLWDVSDVR